MSHDLLQYLAPLVALLTVGGLFLGGMKMILAHRRAMRMAAPDLEQVLEEVAGLREELRAVRGSLVELEERVDFAERLLAKPAAGK